jgi:hypothetical protein
VSTSGPSSFLDPENWTGGFYELAIELGERDDRRLSHALASVWADPRVEGPYLLRDAEPEDQAAVTPTLAAQDNSGHLRGRASLPEGQVVVCGTVIMREDHGPDWLDFYLPVGALAAADARIGAYPFGSEVVIGDDQSTAASLQWRTPVDLWLTSIAEAVFVRVPFRLAVIGWEMSGQLYADDLDEVPPQRGATYLVPDAATLKSYPATN